VCLTKYHSIPHSIRDGENWSKDKVSQKIIRILIVDDVPQVRQGLATMVKLATQKSEQKIEVIGEAKNGNEAIEQAKVLHPDVILMDLEMPGLNGYLATQCIKSEHPSIYIIVLTIHNDPAARQKASQAGADAFFEKTAPLDGLVRAIQGLQ
jgi:DNA-binding NarL/FixJ family response regulator